MQNLNIAHLEPRHTFVIETFSIHFLGNNQGDIKGDSKNTTIGDYVIKPFNIDVLIARLKKILSYFKSKEDSKVG